MAGAQPPQLNIIAPQPGPQREYVNCPVFDVCYGGARGGGKTFASLLDWLYHERLHGKKARGLFVRRTITDLVDTIETAIGLFASFGVKWRDQAKEFRFKSGAVLRMRYLDRDADAAHYQGHQYTRVYVEELTQFPDPAPVDKLKACVRSADGVPGGFRSTCNPGGPGHFWVKARYIDPGPWLVQKRAYENPFTGETESVSQVFIPAKLTDNPKLLQNDPGYVGRVSMAGSEQLVRAWLLGDWDVVEGAYFHEWDATKHVLAPFTIPDHWSRIRGFDWGSASPFSVGWWAVASEDTIRPEGVIPRGALVRYREWYGCGRDQNGAPIPNAGLRLTNGEIARGIREREGKTERISLSVADPSIGQVKGGPSIAEDMAREGVYWVDADNTRKPRDGPISGWAQVRGRLVGQDGRPMLYVFSTCRDFIRTVPALQHDTLNPEDVDTKGEDHIGDETRYVCSARPWTAPAPEQPKPRDYQSQRRRQPADSWRTV